MGLVWRIYKKRAIQELKVSSRQLSTIELSIPSAQDTVLKQRYKVSKINSRACTLTSSLVNAENREGNNFGTN